MRMEDYRGKVHSVKVTFVTIETGPAFMESAAKNIFLLAFCLVLCGAMPPEQKLSWLAIFILPWVLLILFTLRPGGPEKSYEWNMKRASALLPGRWKEKDYFVLWTRRLAWFWLAFFSILFVLGYYFL
jgi:hypothetical protein